MIITPPQLLSQQADSPSVWIAVKTFFAQEGKLSSYLTSRQTPHFIPMFCHYEDDGEGKPVARHRPAVHNLVFVALDQGVQQVREVLHQCPYMHQVYRRFDKKEEWCLITDSEMNDLRQICDMSCVEPRFLSAQECELSVGQHVRVMHGPLKGIQGKMVRKNKKYYKLSPIEDKSLTINTTSCAPSAR